MVGRIKKYFSEVTAEMKRVTWTTRRELVSATAVVVVMVALAAAFIGVADVVFRKIIVIGPAKLLDLLSGGA